jgi:hypothetical protein
LIFEPPRIPRQCFWKITSGRRTVYRWRRVNRQRKGWEEKVVIWWKGKWRFILSCI